MSKVAQEGPGVPKARKAFALFLKERSCVKPGASKLEFAAEMKRRGKVWSSLADAEKAPYQDQSNAEFLARRTALLQMGIPLRHITCAGAKQKESQPQLSDPEPAAGAMLSSGGSMRSTPFWVKAHMEKCFLANACMVAPVP